jgi:hypothetical protein
MNEFRDTSSRSSCVHSEISSGSVDIRLLDRFSSAQR